MKKAWKWLFKKRWLKLMDDAITKCKGKKNVKARVSSMCMYMMCCLYYRASISTREMKWEEGSSQSKSWQLLSACGVEPFKARSLDARRRSVPLTTTAIIPPPSPPRSSYFSSTSSSSYSHARTYVVFIRLVKLRQIILNDVVVNSLQLFVSI